MEDGCFHQVAIYLHANLRSSSAIQRKARMCLIMITEKELLIHHLQ